MSKKKTQYQDAFNERIQRFLIEQPNSGMAQAINTTIQTIGFRQDYYSMFDVAAYRLGMTVLNGIEVVNAKNEEEILGWEPMLRFSDHNVWGKKGGDVSLGPWMENHNCFSMVAKEVVYLFMKVPNLKKALEEKEYV